MKHGQILLDLLLPADQQWPEAIERRMAGLNYLASWAAAKSEFGVSAWFLSLGAHFPLSSIRS